jgi:putative ABC transport system ATP-binding protein
MRRRPGDDDIRHHCRLAGEHSMNTMIATAPSTAAVDLRDVHKVFSAGTAAEVHALRGVNLRIERGEYVAVIGSSGSGKSTLMNLIGCLDAPTSGSVSCNGIEISDLPAAERARLRLREIGFVFQSFQLLSRMSALQNVMLPLAYASVPRAERMPRAQAALARVGLGDRGTHRPTELSGGQQQRVAIARALINNPPLLLADEPTGALDSRTGAEVLDLFDSLHAAGNTIVLITHDSAVAARARRVCTMADGLIVEDRFNPLPQPAELSQ